jgi:hypothetical protein
VDPPLAIVKDRQRGLPVRFFRPYTPHTEAGGGLVVVTTCCLYIAALGSVIAPIFVALLNITAQASAISILGVKMGIEQRNKGMVFRYFAINTSARVNSIPKFRYSLHSRSRKVPAMAVGLHRSCATLL